MRTRAALTGGVTYPALVPRGARLPALLCAFIVVSMAAALAAVPVRQRGESGVSGTVYDENGDVVASASVTAFNTASGVERRATTDGEGFFSVALLPAGTYSVIVRRDGFKTVEVRGVTLGPAGQVRLRVRLTVGAIEEYVTVSARVEEGTEAGAGDDTSAPAATSFNQNFIERHTPAGGNLQALVGLAPGAIVTRTDFNEQGQFSVNGQRANANYFTVDGVSANFGVSAGPAPGQAASGSLPALSSFGGMNNLVSVDAVREFSLQSMTYDAEFGRTPGAQVSVRTSSGTNEWRGSAFYSARRRALDANDWFVNANALPRPPSGQDHLGGVLGGPVIKHHTFAFVSYERLRVTQPRVAVTAVPSVTTRLIAPSEVRPLLEAFPRPNGRELTNASGAAEFAASYGDPSRLDAWSVRLDQTAGSLSLFGRYAQSPSRTSLRGAQNPPTSTTRVTFGFGRPLAESLSTVTESSFETRTLTLGADYARGSRSTLDARFNWSRARGTTRHRLDDFGGATPPPDDYLFPPFASAADGLVQIVVLRPVDMAANLRVGKESDNFNRQLNLVAALGVIRGDHDLKFGGDYRRLSPVFAPPAYTQTATFTNFGFDRLGGEGVISAEVIGAQIYSDEAPREPVFHNVSLFARDVWRAARRLTLSYGLRWELNPPPRESDGRDPSVLTPAALKFITGLRTSLLTVETLGFAPHGTPLWATAFGNFAPRVGVAYDVARTGTTLRAGFGIYYDLGTGQAAQAFGSVIPYASGRRVGRAPYPLGGVNAIPPPPEFGMSAGTLFAFDPQLRTPYTRQWSAEVEQRLGRDHVLSVAYVGAQGRRLTRGEVFLDPFPTFGFLGDTTIVLTRNAARSDYHAMRAQFTRRLSSGLGAYASYTWAHSIDNASDDSSIRLHPEDADPARDRGPSDFDVRHTLSAAVDYDVPALLGGRVGRALTRGWFVGGVARWRTATPVNITLFTDILGGGLVQYLRPDLVTGVPVYINEPRVPGGRYINPAAFADPGIRDGSLGRNALRGFSASQVDFALGRKFRLAGRFELNLRAEAFNVFNHPNFTNPSASLVATRTLGDSLGTGGATGGLIPIYQVGGPRSMQLTLKLKF
jgi:hypothetical protein